MSATRLSDLPIPPRPDYFGPDGAPPGVRLQFDAFVNASGNPWYRNRPLIRPRVAVVHTNAAQREGTLQSQINWGNSAADRTKPHYAVNWPQPTKLVPSDRRAIGNATPLWFEEHEGERDCSYWTLNVETADSGTLADPGISDFLSESVHGTIEVRHDEIVARILAYESVVWGFPLAVPVRWNATGVTTHTWPYPYPHYTTVNGKTCPGDKKKAKFRDEIIGRAQQIKDAWLRPHKEDDMKFIRIKGYADQFLAIPVSAETKSRMQANSAPVMRVLSEVPKAELEEFFGYPLTAYKD